MLRINHNLAFLRRLRLQAMQSTLWWPPPGLECQHSTPSPSPLRMKNDAINVNGKTKKGKYAEKLDQRDHFSLRFSLHYKRSRAFSRPAERRLALFGEMFLAIFPISMRISGGGDDGTRRAERTHSPPAQPKCDRNALAQAPEFLKRLAKMRSEPFVTKHSTRKV